MPSEYCLYCGIIIGGLYGSGRFCSKSCASGFATRDKKKIISQKISRANIGNKNAFGAKHIEAQRQRNSELRKQEYANGLIPFGRGLTKETNSSIARRSEQHKGYKHSNESKIKISEVKKGKPLSKEHCQNISKAAKGRKLSEEHKDKIRQSKLGKPRSPEIGQKISATKRERYGYVEKISVLCGDGCGQMAAPGKKFISGHNSRTEQHPMFGKKHSEETKAKFRGRKLSQDAKDRISKAQKALWEDPEYVARMMILQNRRPTKPEIRLMHILNLYFNDFEYTGARGFIIDGRNPDFVHTDCKLVIEMFGCYPHGCELCGYKGFDKQSPQDRISHFANYGYRTLIIWEHELKDLPTLIQKILEFISILDIAA